MRKSGILLPVFVAIALPGLAAHADDTTPPPPTTSTTTTSTTTTSSSATTPSDSQATGFPTIGVSAGTRALDLELGYSFSPYFGARLVGTDMSPTYKTSRNGIDYRGHYDYKSLSLLGDFYPAAGPFRITAGIVRDEDRIKAQARPGSNGLIVINGGTYPLAPGDQLFADGSFSHEYVPYLGIGFGNPADHHQGVGFTADLGAMYTQNPTVTLTAQGPDAGSPLTQVAVQQEQDKLNHDLHKINVFPVASVGVYYGF